jgi:hypothetical protein
VLAISPIGATCAKDEGPPPDTYYNNFKTAVAASPDRNFTVYWLGREFESGGITFEGPGFPGFAGTSSDERLGYTYCARVPNGDDNGRCVTLNLSFYSKAAWDVAEVELLETGDIQEFPADLGEGSRILRRTIHRSPHSLLAILPRGDTVIVAVSDLGDDANSLANRDEFVRVLQDLRPYPE